MLHPNSMLIDYFVHQGALGAITVSRERLEGYRALVAEAKLNRLVHSILFTLRSAALTPPALRRLDAALDRNLSQLAALVLWPAVRSDGNRERWPETLALMPIGPLVRLPWAALPFPDGRALCQQSETLIVPGLRLGFAYPLSSARARAGRPLVVAVGGDLENVEAETRAVLETFPRAQVLSGPKATAERFIELASHAPWIHFAGHGHYRAESPHESGLCLADRWLTADDLAGIRLSARWVTLSACQTARALVQPGEEWFGMARTLLLCGAGAVVASQWDVEDEAAARLMADMYARLAAGDPLATALARAQARQLEDGAHPFDWAGFVTLGGPRKVSASWGSRFRATHPKSIDPTHCPDVCSATAVAGINMARSHIALDSCTGESRANGRDHDDGARRGAPARRL